MAVLKVKDVNLEVRTLEELEALEKQLPEARKALEEAVSWAGKYVKSKTSSKTYAVLRQKGPYLGRRGAYYYECVVVAPITRAGDRTELFLPDHDGFEEVTLLEVKHTSE